MWQLALVTWLKVLELRAQKAVQAMLAVSPVVQVLLLFPRLLV